MKLLTKLQTQNYSLNIAISPPEESLIYNHIRHGIFCPKRTLEENRGHWAMDITSHNWKCHCTLSCQTRRMWVTSTQLTSCDKWGTLAHRNRDALYQGTRSKCITHVRTPVWTETMTRYGDRSSCYEFGEPRCLDLSSKIDYPSEFDYEFPTVTPATCWNSTSKIPQLLS
jgi:hypothetical protein